MISVLDVFTNEKFKSWITDNESMLALIARQGGSEGVLRSVIGAQFQLIKPELIFVSEKFRVDLILYSENESLACELKHNFIDQKISEIQKNFNHAVVQVVNAGKKFPSRVKNREIVLFLVQLCSIDQRLPAWAKKYKNNTVPLESDCKTVIDQVKGFRCVVDGAVFSLVDNGHEAFNLFAKDIAEVRLHAFVYQSM